MSESSIALVGIISLVIWIVIGRKLLKDSGAKPHRFALWMSGWLGITEMALLIMREGWVLKSIILGMILLLGTLIISYPIAYFSYKLLQK